MFLHLTLISFENAPCWTKLNSHLSFTWNLHFVEFLKWNRPVDDQGPELQSRHKVSKT